MTALYVDGTRYEVDGTDNLLQACLSHGLDLPYFCWHPALGSVGVCRQCAVKEYRDEKDTRGRLVMACMTPVADNKRISIDDAEAVEFREAIIALMMTNHPHDCPVCEEGGHCHLQDMTVMTGHHKRQYHFTKRTHRNQELGPFIHHEMNRCISCYRCVRFYNDYAGGRDLGVFGAASNVYFGRVKSGVLENEFSGNLTEVCPTGVFTDKTHSERYVRKWDMHFAPSVCGGCPVGCNISPAERHGEVRRIENRYHGEINGYFLCDRGRFGYGHVNRKERPRRPLVKRDGVWQVASIADAVAHARSLLGPGIRALGVGSPRASLEANFALRALVGAERFVSGMTQLDTELTGLVLKILRDGPVPAATIRQVDAADAVLVLGEDVLATAPRVALALQQAARGIAPDMARDRRVPEWQAQSALDIAQRLRNPVFVATPAATRFDDIARETLRLDTDAIAALGFAIAHELDPSAPAPPAVTTEISDAAKRIASALGAAKRPLIVSGTSLGSAAVLEAAANVAWALSKQSSSVLLSLAVAEANSLGMALFDAPPLDQALERLGGQESVIVVLENDLDRRLPRETLERVLARARLVVLDHQMTATAERATVVLPAATFAEGDGTLINMEGRAQRYFQNFDPSFVDRTVATAESWRWIGRLRGGDAADENLDAVLVDCEEELAQFKGVVEAAPDATYRIRGMSVARAPHRQSGRTAARAVVFVHEPRSTQDLDTALAFSMEGYHGAGSQDRPPELLPFAWAPGWNSPQAWNKFQTEVGGALKGGDPGVHLFEASRAARAAYFSPAAPSAPAAGLRVVPLYEHFGSEELSRLALPIQARIPASYAVLNADDAKRVGIADHGAVIVNVGGEDASLIASVRADFPHGWVGLPVGLARVPVFVPGEPCTIRMGA